MPKGKSGGGGGSTRSNSSRKSGAGWSAPALAAAATVVAAVCYALFFSAAPVPEETWASRQLLQTVQRVLWAASVADVAAGTANETAAVAALNAVHEDLTVDSWAGISPLLLQLAKLAQTEMRLRLLFATLSCLDKMAFASGSDVEMQHAVATAYKQAYPLLVGESQVLLAEQANWRQYERFAHLSRGPTGMPGGDVPKGDAATASLLVSSSYWDGGALTIVRAMHQQPAGAEHWRRLGWGIETCGSLNGTAVLAEFEGSVVHRRSPVIDMIHSCIADINVVEAATARGAKVGIANRHGWTPLHHIALLGPRDLEQRLLTQLLEAGAQPTDKNSLGHTPLHVAAYRGAPQVVAKLLAAAPELVNQRDRLGRSPADLACLHKPVLAAAASHSEVVQEIADDDWMGGVYTVLLNAGAEPCQVDTKDPSDGTTEKKSKKTSKKKSKKAQKALRALEWSPTQWGPSTTMPEGLADDHCDLDQADSSLSSDDFLHNYVSVNRPVIIRQADMAGSPISPHPGRSVTREESLKPWSEKALRSRFGNLLMEAVNIPYAGSFEGGITRETTVPRFLDELEEVGKRRQEEQHAENRQSISSTDQNISAGSSASVEEDPMYIFGNIDGSKESGLIVGEPTVTLGQKFSGACRPGVTQLYLGGPGSGSPVHWHNDAINYAVHGSKLWTMLPPPHAVYSRRHASVDAVQVPIEAAARNQSGSVLRCVQRPGDLIYVPDGWGHGVLNLGATAGW